MSEEGRWELPEGWEWASANRFARVVGGGTPANAKDTDNYAGDGIPWITPADLSGYKATHISAGRRSLSKKGFASSSARLIPKGSVLLSSRAPVGYCVVAANDISTNQGFKSFVPESPDIQPEFLRYYLIGSKRYLESESSGTTFLELSGGRAEQLVFPIAPRKEQKRIVSKIDELFSSVDEGERALERVRKLVKHYRQSVLKAAVMGELTRAWREKHVGESEPGEAPLARILEARRKAWEKSELDKMKTSGIKAASGAWRNKYKEPVAPGQTDMIELPIGWAWASIDQLCSLITSGSRGWKEHYADSGSLFIRAQNIKHDLLEMNDVAFVDLSTVTEGLRTKVAKDDLLITITGANVTKSALVLHDIEDAYVSQHVALVRPVCRSLSSFLFHWIVSAANGRKQLLAASYGAGKPGLSLEDIKQVTVPLPPERERQLICERIELEMSRLSHLESDGEMQEVAATGLRQAILKAAFTGKLVPQDPEDEPASVVLERIASGRSESPKSSGTKSARKKKVKA